MVKKARALQWNPMIGWLEELGREVAVVAAQITMPVAAVAATVVWAAWVEQSTESAACSSMVAKVELNVPSLQMNLDCFSSDNSQAQACQMSVKLN